jgi:osmotically-inducible protein OsmY
MRTLFVLALLGVGGMVCYNYSTGRDLLQLPGTSAEALKDSVRDTVSGAVRETVKGTVRETTAEVKERAKAGVHTATDRAEEAVAAAAVTSKIKAKMALDDLVKAADIDVDTDGGVVTLTGTVESVEERRRAVRIATETKGVTKVVEHLRVQ